VFAFLPSLYPFGWYACNWQELDRIAHGDLFSKLGLSYGPGNGSTTFNVPDLRARVPVSANMVATGNPAALSADGDGEYGSFGTVYGVKKAALTMAQMPSHDHPGSVTGFSTLPDPIPYGAEPGGFLFDAGSASFYANTSHYHNVTIALQGGATVVDRRNPEMVFTFGIYSGV
jgi:microcystin-dependent protein